MVGAVVCPRSIDSRLDPRTHKPRCTAPSAPAAGKPAAALRLREESGDRKTSLPSRHCGRRTETDTTSSIPRLACAIQLAINPGRPSRLVARSPATVPPGTATPSFTSPGVAARVARVATACSVGSPATLGPASTVPSRNPAHTTAQLRRHPLCRNTPSRDDRCNFDDTAFLPSRPETFHARALHPDGAPFDTAQ